MNIFYLDPNPKTCAEMHVSKHVVKMIIETAQLLYTSHWVLSPTKIPEFAYKKSHVNHPSAIWCRESVENYNWLVDHFFALMQEYTHRYDKTHKCYGELSYMLQSPPKNLQEWDMTTMPSAMADEYKISNDPLTNYRNYYRIGKLKMHKWTNREPPEWIQ